MKTITRILLISLLLSGAVFTSCERRELCDGPDATASVQVPVAIDWSQSGITPTSRAGGDFVHRVSLRFFPKDGSQAFDRYLEGDVYNGFVDVPLGDYSVIVYNEALDDNYWSNNLYFSDIDDFGAFAANLINDNPTNYDFYTVAPGETLSMEPLKLASWSLDDFRVTSPMSDQMYNALTVVKLYKLTYWSTVAVTATHLNSSYLMHGILKGLVNKVQMASRQVIASPSTHIFLFDAITWSDPTQTDGTIRGRFLTFGRQPDPDATYWLALDVILKSGARYVPPTPFVFDVSDQVHAPSNTDVNISVNIALPELKDGVDVGDWDDGEIPIH